MPLSLPQAWMPTFGLAAFLLLVLAAPSALAANPPCSGKKGGIAGCDGELFLCNDGSISGSKRNCAAYMGRGGTSPAQPRQLLDDNTSDCPCGTSTFCTGPRGGVYCLTPGGKKSYRRK
ncbi:YdcA family protein [Zestomonas carbonaria]|uniref:Uncharacterized protein n=1 Tax=Zestomonas carbonaria TaxID=2762745 RepID=A0A7U7EKF9_9GAMM|nr:hypothetical protein [Pseudomonas carbonaria]CAD5106638.1 hypothetical protein PSEWESI4_00904 [Pseudomonas carbonaria]